MTTTYAVQTVEIKTGAVTSMLGLIAADSAEAAIARAAELMEYDSAAEMAADYAKAYKPQSIIAAVSDQPARYTA